LSITATMMFAVPDFGGFPPSTAVTVSLMAGCCSRSRAFRSTSSADTLLYVLTLFFPTSRSDAPTNPNFPPGAVLSAILRDCSVSEKYGALSFISIMFIANRYSFSGLLTTASTLTTHFSAFAQSSSRSILSVT
uniref:Uncharacterized protein n=1 Tax=Poecilia mexicana TaxID=48701 RepID=A0A3B3Z1G1_9TELE